MKKKLFTVAILAVSASLIIMSCSKTSNTTSGGVYAPTTNPKGANTGGSTGNNLTFSSTGDPSGTYSGFLFTVSESVPGYSVATCQAGFFISPQAIHPSVGNIGVSTGTVSSIHFNGVHIPYSTANQNYSDSTNMLVFPPAVWSISGNTTFPSFTYTNTTPTPILTSSTLPSTIIRSQNFVVPANAISGCDQVQMQVADGLGKTITMYFSTSSGSVALPIDSLTKLSATASSGTIRSYFN